MSVRQRRLQADDRGVSIAVGYVLSLGIATLLFSVLLIGGSGMIESQTRSVTYDQLSVTGQQLAADLSGADRLARANVSDGEDPETLRLRTDLPDRTAAGGYTVEISHDGTEGTIELRTRNPDVTASVSFRSVTPVQGVTVSGGTVETGYESDELVVESV